MKIKLHEITVGELAEGYVDNAEEGVRGYGGRLDIRPKYQREFVYKDAQRDAVIHTVCRGFPLNVMYWVKNADDAYEVLDGQQRTVSLCQYVAGQFSVDIEGRPYYFHTLPLLFLIGNLVVLPLLPVIFGLALLMLLLTALHLPYVWIADATDLLLARLGLLEEYKFL